MSYVAISGRVIEKVVREARERPSEQVVGVLIGGQSGGAIVVEDTATGSSESSDTKATLTGDSIARIADDIINKRIRGSIVGWYHSHVRGGVFMSETDMETQLKLQQFSPLVTAMVIDTQTGESGFFRADQKTKESIRVPSQDTGAALAPPVSASFPGERAMYPQAPPLPASAPLSIRTILIAVILITLAVTGGIIALAYYRTPGAYGGNLGITHNPPREPFVIANPITFDANVTGSNLSNVTLAYRVIEQAPDGKGLIVGDLVKVPMLLRAAGKDTYSYTVPSSEISGVYINYYISAFDSNGNVVRTDVYNLSVGDFDWVADKTDEIIAIRTMPTQVRLDIAPINGFSKAVTIRVVGSAPAGVSVRALSAQVTPPNPAVLEIRSTSDSELVQSYNMEIDATYSPPGASAVQIIRRTTLVLTVTDFIMDVHPNYLEVQRGKDKDVTYTLNLKVYDGFTAPSGFKFEVNGLPEHTTWRLELQNYVVRPDEMAETNYSLIVRVQSNTPTGLFLFTVKITAVTSGGSIYHDKTNIQLKVT